MKEFSSSSLKLKNCKRFFSFANAHLIGVSLLFAFLSSPDLHAATTWSGGTTGNWTLATNWDTGISPTSGTVTLNDSGGTGLTITLDTSNTVNLSGLTLQESNSGQTTSLVIGANIPAGGYGLYAGTLAMTATNGGSTLISMQSGTTVAYGSSPYTTVMRVGTASNSTTIIGATGGGTSTILLNIGLGSATTSTTKYNFLQTYNSNGTVQINAGGQVAIGDTMDNVVGVLAQQNAIDGNLYMNGGIYVALRPQTTISGNSQGYVNENIITGSLTMDSGIIKLEGYNSTSYTNSTDGVRLKITGNMTLNGGSLIVQNGSQSNTYIELGGTTNTISSSAQLMTMKGAAATTFDTTGAVVDTTGAYLSNDPMFLFVASTGTQTLTSGVKLYNVDQRTTTSGTALITVNVQDSTGNIGGLFFDLQQNATGTIKLGSNLTSYSTASMPGSFLGIKTGATAIIDLNGYTYDASLITASSGIWTPYNNTDTVWKVINSSATEGVFRAGGFNLTNTSTASGSKVPFVIGDNVVLEATSAGLTNNLSLLGTGTGGTQGTFSPTSKFYYTGTGTASVTVGTSTVVLGKLEVGSHTVWSNSTLKLLSGIKTAGNTIINVSSTLDLNGQALVLSSNSGVGASLVTQGGGTLSNSSTSALATLSFDGTATTLGGLNPGGTGTISTLNVNGGTKGLTINLANSESTLDINATSGTFDQVIATGSLTTMTFTGGKLIFNFTGNESAATYTIFSGFTSYTGTLTSVTYNGLNAGWAALFNEANGTLNIYAVAIPEPSLALLGAIAGLILGGLKIRRMRRA